MRNAVVVYIGAAINVAWGAIVLCFGTQQTTALAGLTNLGLPPGMFGVSLIIVAAMAIIGATRHPIMKYQALLIPQAYFFVLSGLVTLNLIISQKYADGVVRPWYFVLADQAPILLLSIFHTWVVVSAIRQAVREFPAQRKGMKY